MDELKKLSYDVEVYRELIYGYSDDPYIKQSVKNLIECIQKRDMSGTLYFLERVKDWYEQNISEIVNNEWVYNEESHILALTQLQEYFKNFSNYTDESEILKAVDKPTQNIKSVEDSYGYNIFISHSSRDEPICTAFVQLLEVLGVPEKNILYSSQERFGIPADMDIFDYLKSSIVEQFNVYYMLSDNYYDSVYCLNEMGAAWVNQNEFSIYLLPNLTKPIAGVIDSNRKGYRLDNIISLNQLREKISKDFAHSISDNKWDEEKQKFLKVVNQYS